MNEKKMTIANEIKFGLMSLVISCFLLGAGAGMGFYWATKEFRSKINLHAQAETLGSLLDTDETRNTTALSQSYYDPAQAENEFDNYSWNVPTVISPFVGYAPKPGKHANAEINSTQFRSHQELIIPKPASNFRIFITGGSTAFSTGAPSQDKIIAAYLSRLLNDNLSSSTQRHYEVFTMASPGWASTHERIIIENRLSEFEPDLVISFSGNNDVHWGVLGWNVLWFRSYNDGFYWNLVNTLYGTAGFTRMHDVVKNQADKVLPAMVAKRLEKNIHLSTHALSLQKVPYIFILQPTLAVTNKSLSEYETQQVKLHLKEYFIECYTKIDARLSQVQADNFTYFNLSNIFDDESSKNQLFLDRYHFGDKGNEIIAEQIYQSIKNIVAPAI